MNSRLSIRAFLSTVVYAASAVLGIAIYFYSTSHTVDYILSEHQELSESVAIQLARWLEEETARGEIPSAEFDAIVMTTLPDEGLGVLLDGRGEPLLKLSEAQQEVLDASRKALPPSTLATVLKTRRHLTYYDQKVHQLYLLQPFLLPPLPGTLRSHRLGILLLQHDISPELAAAQRKVFWTTLSVTAFLLLMALALIQFFSRLIINRLESLLERVRPYRSPPSATRTNGDRLDEIEELAASFESLIQNLEEQQAAAHQVELERSLQRITNQLPQVVFQLEAIPNERRRFTFVSARMQSLMGVDPEEMKRDGNIVLKHLSPEEASSITAALNTAQAQNANLDFTFKWGQGLEAPRWIHCVAQAEPLSPAGLLWTGFMQDATEQKKYEHILIEARRTAEEADRSKSAFLASVSHEVRTPMNAIIGLTHLALRTNLDRKQHDYLSKIQTAATSLLRLINDLLDFSKIEADRLELEVNAFVVNEMLAHVMGMMSQKALEKGLSLTLNPHCNLSRVVKGDMLRLSQVLLNLVSNAVKFTSKGHIEIDVQELEGTEERVQLQFTVCDTGIGIPQEVQSKLFKPFSQADGSTTRSYGGTGLGLSISKRLVELMGGRIWLDSSPGKGSQFHFTAWFEKADGRLTHQLPFRRSRPGERLVMVVDDNASALNMLQQLLTSGEFQVIGYRSAQPALERLRDIHQPAVDVLIIDWQLPDIDGVELLTQLVASPGPHPVPHVLMMTAFDVQALEKLVRTLPVHAVLSKPIRHQELLATLHSVQTVEPPPQTVAPLPSSPEQRRPRILLAEDNDLNQQIMLELLSEAELAVDVANNGEEAVQKMQQSLANTPYALVLMDIQMPVMDGLEATRRLRALPGLESVPIIALTAHARPEERQVCLDAGMNDHITKPIDPDTFFDVLQRHLQAADATSSPVTPDNLPSSAIAAQPMQERAVFVERPPVAEADAPPAVPQKIQQHRITDNLSRINGLELPSGLKNSENNPGLYGERLLRFAQEYASITVRLESALRRDDRLTLEKLATLLSGAAEEVGAKRVANVAAQMTSMSSLSSTQELLPILSELSGALAQLVAQIHAQLTTSSPLNVSPVENASTQQDVKKVLDTLLLYVRESDGEAVEFFLQNEGTLYTAIPVDQMESLQQRLMNYDFDASQALIQQMIAKRARIAEESVQ